MSFFLLLLFEALKLNCDVDLKYTIIIQNLQLQRCIICVSVDNNLMGEGFILLTRGYGFMRGVPPPFWHIKIGTSTDDTKLKLYS